MLKNILSTSVYPKNRTNYNSAYQNQTSVIQRTLATLKADTVSFKGAKKGLKIVKGVNKDLFYNAQEDLVKRITYLNGKTRKTTLYWQGTKSETFLFDNKLKGKNSIIAEIEPAPMEETLYDEKERPVRKSQYYKSGYLKETFHYKNGKLFLNNKYKEEDNVLNEIYQYKSGGTFCVHKVVIVENKGIEFPTFCDKN